MHKTKTRIFISALLVLSLIGIINYTPSTPNLLENSIVLPHTAWVSNHDPIVISGDEALAAYCAGNDTDGSWNNPHVIKNYIIDANGGDGITISNTRLHLRIQNCTIFNATGTFKMGISLANSHNVTIYNNTFSNDYIGMHLNTATNCSVQNNSLNALSVAIELETSSNSNIIDGNQIREGVYGIVTSFVEDISIENNQISDCEYVAILINDAINITLHANAMNGCGPHFSIDYKGLAGACSHHIDTSNIVDGKPVLYYVNQTGLLPAQFSNAGAIILANCSECLVNNIAIEGGSNAIQLLYSKNNTISSNQFKGQTFAGVFLQNGSNNKILNNNITNGLNTGISLEWDNTGTIIDGNQIRDAESGIEVGFTSDICIQNNLISDCTSSAIAFYDAINITLYGNSMIGCGPHISLMLEGIDSICSHHIDTSNTVGGKPVLYYVNQANLLPAQFANAGAIILANCSNCMVDGVAIEGGTSGIELFYGSNNTFSNNRFKGQLSSGILLLNGTNNKILHNNITDGIETGIELHDDNLDTIIHGNLLINNKFAGIEDISSNRTQIDDNIIRNGEYGIRFSFCYNSTIQSNTILNNAQLGLYLTFSSSCTIYRNTFAGNKGGEANVAWNSNFNQWDNGSIGNYWGDYRSRYPSATAVGGIWNLPYQINTTAYLDNFPLTSSPTNSPPALSHPDNITYGLGVTGSSLSWLITDLTATSLTYFLYRDDVLIETDTCYSGTPIVVNVDRLSVGTHIFRLVVNDGLGSQVSNEVEVIVIEPDFPWFIIVIIIGAAVAVAILFASYSKKRKLDISLEAQVYVIPDATKMAFLQDQSYWSSPFPLQFPISPKQYAEIEKELAVMDPSEVKAMVAYLDNFRKSFDKDDFEEPPTEE